MQHFARPPTLGPSKENRQLRLKRPDLPKGSFQGRVLKVSVGGRVVGGLISLWMLFWRVGGKRETFGESASPTFSFQPVCSLWACSLHSVNFFHLAGVLVSAKQLEDMPQDIIYSFWGGTWGSWLCSAAKLLLFYLAWLFFFFCISSLPWLNLLFGPWGSPRRLKLFYRQEAGDTWGGGKICLQKALQSCSVSKAKNVLF